MIDNEKNKDSFEYGSLSFKGDVPHFDGDDDDAIDIVKKKRRAPSAVSKKTGRTASGDRRTPTASHSSSSGGRERVEPTAEFNLEDITAMYARRSADRADEREFYTEAGRMQEEKNRSGRQRPVGSSASRGASSAQSRTAHSDASRSSSAQNAARRRGVSDVDSAGDSGSGGAGRAAGSSSVSGSAGRPSSRAAESSRRNGNVRSSAPRTPSSGSHAGASASYGGNGTSGGGTGPSGGSGTSDRNGRSGTSANGRTVPAGDRRPYYGNARSEGARSSSVYTSGRQNRSNRGAKRRMTVGCVIRRTLLVLLTAILFTVGSLLAVCNTLANGPSKTARDKAVMSALQASATKWVPGLFLSSDTVEEIKKNSQVVVTDVKPITDISSGDGDGDTPTADKWANAIDGMIYENVNGTTFKGYVLLIKDPARVTVGVSSNDFAHATAGMRIFELADKYNAVAAINAGEFRDDGGVGTGYAPMGLTYSEGNCVWNDGLSRTFMGFDKNNRLYVAEGTTYAQAEELGMRDAVSFQTGNVLITNDGTNVTYYYADSNTGVAQRTAIGQCADGTVIFLVTDGRTASSMGATRNEIIDTLISYGAVTAGMLDGGSSSMLYYRDYFTKYNIDQSQLDEYQKMGLVNKYKAFTNPRRIPTYFIVKP